ncbi:hypothetical protein AB205_0144300, partial [Aquarana catesbeiana]
HGQNITLLDPCFNPGYTRNVSTADLYSSPCVSDRRILTIPQTIQIKGTGNYQLCKDKVENIFNLSHCSYSRCSFNGIFQPMLQGEFGAFSAFYFVMDFLKVTKEKVSLDGVKDSVERHCSKPWAEVKREAVRIKEKYLSEYCFSAVYILNLLDLYGFNSSSWEDITFFGKRSLKRRAVEGAGAAGSGSQRCAERLSHLPVRPSGWILTLWGSLQSLEGLSDVSLQQALARCWLILGHRSTKI